MIISRHKVIFFAVIVSLFATCLINVDVAVAHPHVPPAPDGHIHMWDESDPTHECAGNGWGISYKIVDCIMSFMNRVTDSVITLTINTIGGVVQTVATLAIMFYGIKVVLGGAYLRKDTSLLILKLVIILGVTADPAFLIGFKDAVIGGSMALGQLVMSTTAGILPTTPCFTLDSVSANFPVTTSPPLVPCDADPLGVFIQLDVLVARMVGWDVTRGVPDTTQMVIVGILLGAVLFFPGIGQAIAGTILMLFLAVIFMIVEAIFLYISAFIAISVLIALGPLLLPLLFFHDLLKKVALEWFRDIFGYALMPVLLVTALTMFFAVLDQQAIFLEAIFQDVRDQRDNPDPSQRQSSTIFRFPEINVNAQLPRYVDATIHINSYGELRIPVDSTKGIKLGDEYGPIVNGDSCTTYVPWCHGNVTQLPAINPITGGPSQFSYGLTFPTPDNNDYDVIAAGDGTITAIGEHIVDVVVTNPTRANFGNMIVIRHEPRNPDTYTLYAHLRSFANDPSDGNPWAAGDTVTKGDVLGIIGQTGSAANAPWKPHLYFEVQIPVQGVFTPIDILATNIPKPAASLTTLGTNVLGAAQQGLSVFDGALSVAEENINSATSRVNFAIAALELLFDEQQWKTFLAQLLAFWITLVVLIGFMKSLPSWLDRFVGTGGFITGIDSSGTNLIKSVLDVATELNPVQRVSKALGVAKKAAKSVT